MQRRIVTRELIDRIYTDPLDQAGLPWEVKQGQRHHKLFAKGRLIAVFPRGRHRSAPRGAENTLATIRRFIRQQKEGL